LFALFRICRWRLFYFYSYDYEASSCNAHFTDFYCGYYCIHFGERSGKPWKKALLEIITVKLNTCYFIIVDGRKCSDETHRETGKSPDMKFCDQEII